MRCSEFVWSPKPPVVPSYYVAAVPSPIVFIVNIGSTFMTWSSEIFYSYQDARVLHLAMNLIDVTDDRAVIAPVSFRFQLTNFAKDGTSLTAVIEINDTYQRNQQITCSFTGIENTENFLFGNQVKRFSIKCSVELSENWFKDLNPFNVVIQPEVIPKVVSELFEEAISRSDSVSFTDVTLISSNGDEFHCHSSFLAKQSSVLKSVLESQSSSGNDKQSISFNDVDSATLVEVLRYVYTETVSDDLKPLASKVLYAVEKYLLSSVLKDHCHKALLDSLNVENGVEYLLVADKYGLKQLKVASIDVIVRNLAVVRKQAYWLSFLRDHSFLVDDVFEAVCENKIKACVGLCAQ